jgi:hypothetical protein
MKIISEPQHFLSVTEKLVRIQINTEANWIKTLINNSALAHFVLGFLNLH